MEDKRRFKNELFAEFARIGQALAGGRRLELLDVLAQGERTVEDLARETAMSVASASQHLQVLRHAGLVEARKVGTYVYYRPAGDGVVRLWQTLRDVGVERLDEIGRITDDYLGRRDTWEPVGMADLSRRLRAGDVLLLDVRPRLEYEAGHIQGARSIPIDELPTRLPEIPQGSAVVAYCRGPYCVFADEAVTLLRAYGIEALRLEAGYPDWKLAGLPVETA